MMYWLWRGVLICVVLGSVQWGYTHPDSQLTTEAKKLWAEVKAEVSNLF